MIPANSIITAAAHDEAQKRNIKFSVQSQSEKLLPTFNQNAISETPPQIPRENTLTIALGSDHGGFSMKETLKIYLTEQGNRIIDVGADCEQACDYPDFAYAVAALVSSGKAERGIMIDSVGVASAIVANKVPGVRAVPCYDEFVARSSREHNNANVLVLGGRVVDVPTAEKLVTAWLDATFEGGRHQGRLDKITALERELGLAR